MQRRAYHIMPDMYGELVFRYYKKEKHWSLKPFTYILIAGILIGLAVLLFQVFGDSSSMFSKNNINLNTIYTGFSILFLFFLFILLSKSQKEFKRRNNFEHIKEYGFMMFEKKHGTWITKNEKGVVTEVAHYEYGVKSGPYYEFWPNGGIKLQGSQVDGKLHGAAGNFNSFGKKLPLQEYWEGEKIDFDTKLEKIKNLENKTKGKK